jgi:predicted MFS family arabinose efflux permease
MNDLASVTLEHRAQAHAARRTALACMVALAVTLGVGRFAFTPLLPLMLKEGMLDIQQGGWLASANYAGYCLGALTCAALRVDAARVVRWGLVATALLVLAMGVTHGFWIWLAIRFAAGVASAWTFVFASQWGLRRLAELHASALGGMIYMGPGFSIAATGLFVSVAGGLGATAGWFGFGVVAASLTALVWRVFAPARGGTAQRVPVARQPDPAQTSTASHAGTFANGARRSPTPACATSSNPAATAPTSPGATFVHSAHATHSTHAAHDLPPTHHSDALWLIVLYAMPGFGYIITATFLPVIARAALPGSVWPDLFWPMFGVALMVGAWAGTRLPLHWDNRTLMAVSYVLQAVGIALSIVWPSVGGFALGSVLIGLPFTAITLFAMREARRLHGDAAAGLMGYATAAYGLGQILGPLVAAPIAARTGSFTPALWLAAAVLLAGAAGLGLVTARRAR